MGDYKYSYTLPGTDIVVHSDVPQEQQSSSVMKPTPSNNPTVMNNNNVSYGGIVIDRDGHKTQSYTENNRYGQQSGTVALGSVFDPNSQNYDYDYAHGLAENINGQKVFYDANGRLSTAAQALKDSQANNRVYGSVPNSSSGGGSYSSYLLNNNGISYGGDISNNISNLAAAQKAKALADLDKARTTVLSNLDAQKSTIQPLYYNQRANASNQSQLQAKNFAEFMAARGQSGAGISGQAELNRNTDLQGEIGNLNQQENTALNDIERNRTLANNNYASDVASANAGIDAQMLQNQISQQNADRSYGLQYQQMQNALQQQALDNTFRQQQADIQNALQKGQLTAQQAQQALDNAYRQSRAAEEDNRWLNQYRNSQTQYSDQQAQQAYENQLKQQQLAQQYALAQQKSSNASASTQQKQDVTAAKNNAYTNLYSLLDTDIQLAREWLNDNQESLINALGTTEYEKMRNLYLQRAKQS